MVFVLKISKNGQRPHFFQAISTVAMIYSLTWKLLDLLSIFPEVISMITTMQNFFKAVIRNQNTLI